MPSATARETKKGNREILQELLIEIHSVKNQLNEIRIEIAKLNQIENKIKKGENIANTNGGWFWS
tara:strand:- start:9634 stop:9828 length:195 start_codon:yes stop_codon:yes gene_type:complete